MKYTGKKIDHEQKIK